MRGVLAHKSLELIFYSFTDNLKGFAISLENVTIICIDSRLSPENRKSLLADLLLSVLPQHFSSTETNRGRTSSKLSTIKHM